MIAAYLPTEQTWYFAGKQIYDENFAIYDYVTRNYRFVGIFGTAEGAPVDVFERNESADDSRLLLIAALQYRMKTKAEIQKYTDDIDRLTRQPQPGTRQQVSK